MRMVVGVQSLAIMVLGLALYNDYLHNVYLRVYVDSAVQRYIVAYSVFVGLFSGLILAIAATTVLDKRGPVSETKLEDHSPMLGPLAISSQAGRLKREQQGKPRPPSATGRFEQGSSSLASQERAVMRPPHFEARFLSGRVSHRFQADWPYC